MASGSITDIRWLNLDVFVFTIGTLISLLILYFVIKLAVRNAIIEARNRADSTHDVCDKNEGTDIAQVVCAGCGRKHDMDYPKCPFCKYNNGDS